MNPLLDTCAVLTLSNGPLPHRAAGAFGAARQAFVSPVSAWEVAIKFHLGKLQLTASPLAWFQTLCLHYHLTVLPLTTELLCAAADLPPLHRDPFDRILIAAAIEQNLTILTTDATIGAYPGITTIW